MTRPLIVDSSVALKWFLKEIDADKADDILRAERDLFAPDFLLAEVANGLRRQQRNAVISAESVNEAVAGLAGVFTELLPTGVLILDALLISQQLDHSIYDCLFLAASRMRDAQFVTADTAFVSKVSGTQDASRVIALADWK